MTTNAFLLSWGHCGLEAGVPVTQYKDPDWLVGALATGKIPANPLNGIPLNCEQDSTHIDIMKSML
jgi:hypothetical protein